MKKVFFLMVFLLLGGIAQAASIVWGSANPLATVGASPAGGDLSNYVAYLCVGGADVANGTLASIQAGTWEAPELSRNLTAGGQVPRETSLLGSGIEAGTPYEFFVVIFDEERQNVMISSVVSGTPYDEGGTDPASSIGWTADQFKGTADWTAIGDVPEPTVLALLALGVAGLALKRRVA